MTAAVPYFEPISFLNQRIECQSDGVYSVRDAGDGFISLDYYGKSLICIKLKNRLHDTVYNEITAIIKACVKHDLITFCQEQGLD